MRPLEITKEKKERLEQHLKRQRMIPARGEMNISFSPEGKIGNIKITTNH